MTAKLKTGWLLAVHATMTWAVVPSVAATGGAHQDHSYFVGVVLLSSQMCLSGIVLGWMAVYASTIESKTVRSLLALGFGLPCAWLPLSVVARLPKDVDLSLLLLFVAGILMFFTAITMIMMRVFKLRLIETALPDANYGTFQFSLRGLMITTTLVALAVSLPRVVDHLFWVKTAEEFVFTLVCALGGLISVLLVAGVVAVGVPLATVMLARRPWRMSLVAIVATLGIVTGAWLAFDRPSAAMIQRELFIVGGHLVLTMASLGVLRSCGLRFVRRETLEVERR